MYLTRHVLVQTFIFILKNVQENINNLVLNNVLVVNFKRRNS